MMKRAILLTIMSVFLLSLFSYAALAAGEIAVGTVTFGDENQKRNNPLADDVKDEIVGLTKTFTITNNAGGELSNIVITSSAQSGEYNVSFANVPSTMTVGQVATVTILTNVAKNHRAFDATLNKPEDKNNRIFTIGDINVVAKNATTIDVTGTGSIRLQAENNLEIKRVDVKKDGSSDKVKDGDDIKVKPGDKLEFTFEVESLFSKSDDVDIDDVEIEITIDDDGDFDIEDENIDFNSLSPKDEDKEVIRIDVDQEAEDKDHKVVLLLTGTDENGAKHGDRIEFSLNVERKNHEIKIESIDISPTPISCTTKTAEVSVRILNIGKNDEEEVSVEVEVANLDYRERLYDLDMDEDDSLTKVFRVPIPANNAGGEYPVTVETYFDRTDFSNSDAVLMSVPDCSVPAPVVVPQPVPVPVPVPEPTPEPETVKPEKSESIFDNSEMYLWALGGIIVVLVLVVIGLSWKFIFGKEE